MSKRRPLGGQLNIPALAATQEKAEAGDLPGDADELIVASVSLPVAVHRLLYRLASARRYARRGGRASLSAEIAALVEKHRAELQAELDELEARG